MQHAPDSSNHSLHVVKQSSPAILRETSKGTSYYMVRLVFRPIYNCMTNDLHVGIAIDFQLGFPPNSPFICIVRHNSGTNVHASAQTHSDIFAGEL